MINLLVKTPNQLTIFRIKIGSKINDDSRGKSNTNIQIKFKTSIIR